MRIESEISTLSYAELVEYAVAQQEKMKEIINEKNLSLEQIRMRIRIPRKCALFAAKRLFKERPEMYDAYLEKLNKMTPRYLTKEEAEKYGVQKHPDRSPYLVTRQIDRNVLRFAFIHREREKD